MRTLAGCIKTKYNTYLLENEDVLEIYNRLLRSPHITDHRTCSEREGEWVTHFCRRVGDAPEERGGEYQQH